MESKFYNFAVTIAFQRLIVRKIFNEFANPKLIILPTGEGNTGLKYYVLATYKLSRSASCILLTVERHFLRVTSCQQVLPELTNCSEVLFAS